MDIEDILNSHEGFIFLIFLSNHCPNCEGSLKTLKKISALRPDIKMIKINADQHPNEAIKYSVSQVPTVLIYCKDILIDQVVGDRDMSRYFLKMKFDIESEKEVS